MEYPLTKEDLNEVGHRMAQGESCYIPIRRDIEMTDGRLATNCLVWGSPKAYEIVMVGQGQEAQYYGRYKS